MFQEAAKAKSAEDKLAVRVKGYSEADFESAMEKVHIYALLLRPTRSSLHPAPHRPDATFP